MDLDSAIGAHAQWKIKLRAGIDRKEQMDALTIGKDNCCELGKWMYGEGRQTLGSKPEFVTLIERHKLFHTEAGKVAQAINTAKYEQAAKMIESGSAFASASTAVGVAIGALKKVAWIK
ncbi:MAG TPA: CZB domain-containing protein [Rhodoferax sp.]|jgi:methyl-accepting chemotaxis protein|nr:CZB domain-containing protein [Rhodoferax sp.]HPW28508.1 CZB domain-containing protein [Rhodoferax sp.]